MKEYYNYLRSRSFCGYLYRKFILYPRIKKYSINKTLDIGCGIGDYLKYDNNSIGVDINVNCVNYCKKNGLNATIMEVDNLPFDNDSFNTIVFDNVLEHLENPKKILNEIKRVLNSRGYFIVGVPCEKGFEHDDDHKQFYDVNDLKTLLSNDFNLVKYFYSPPLFYPLRKYVKQVALYVIFKKK